MLRRLLVTLLAGWLLKELVGRAERGVDRVSRPSGSPDKLLWLSSGAGPLRLARLK